MNEPIRIKIDEELKNLLEGYLLKREEDRITILSALESGDFEVIRMLSHRMKGSGGGYGLQFISVLGREVEQFAHALDAASITQWMEKLKDYLALLEIEFVPEDEV